MARKKLVIKKLQGSKINNNCFIAIGLVLVSIFSLWRYNRIRILSFSSSGVPSLVATGIKPVHIKSYPVGIDVEVQQTSISKGVWIIPDKAAGHLGSSSGINGGGNIVIYGHNKNDILGPLRWIKKGAEIVLTGKDGRGYKYVVSEIVEVSPDNLEYIKNSGSEVLTVYTCSGFLDNKRFVVIAKPAPKLSNP